MADRKSRTDRLNRLHTFTYPKRKTRPPSPREEASFLQVLFVTWLLPLLKTGMKRELTEHDLYPTLFDDQADHIGDRLEIMWGDYVEQCRIKEKKPSIFHLLWKAFATKFFFFGMFSLSEECIFRMIQVIAIGYVLDYFEGNYLTTFTGTMLFGVGGILLGSVAFLISFHWSIFNLHHVCCHIRIGLSSLVYRKLLHLNHRALRDSTVGQLVSMIASDLHRFDRKHIQVNYVWIAPIHLVVVVYVLYFHYHYGAHSLIGLFVLLFFTIIQYIMAKKFMDMRQKRVDSSDFRIRAVVEIINAFYAIKVQCWETFFQYKAMENRKTETKVLRATMLLRLLNAAIGFVVTKMSVFLTLLVAFLYDDDKMDAKRVFVTLILYEHVRVNCVLLFPQAVHDCAELICSCRRIEQFLCAEELEVPNTEHALEMVNKSGTGTQEENMAPRIEVSNLSCRWTRDEGFQLTNISFTVKKGELVVVAGPVGSGKTTLISSILGEIPPDDGHVLVVGRIAYVPQEPAIFPGSIRRNIIFGYGVNQRWYDEVCTICGLDLDFKLFAKGDQSLTETTKLTMAQRIRINIARALYANAEVYILDDPLQSMDLKHYHNFLDTILHGVLADKVTLLVTHQVYVLEEATNIILMYDGEIQQQGSYQEFKEQGIEFLGETEDEDEFNDESEDDFDEDEYEEVTDASESEDDANLTWLVEEDLVPVLTNPKEHRHIAQINFDIDQKDKKIKKVSQGPVTEDRRRTQRKETITNSLDDSQKGGGYGDGFAHLAVVANDGGAYDAQDVILQPKKISFRLYYHFLRAGSSKWTLAMLLLICIISQALYTATDIWIEDWAHYEEKKQKEKKVHGEDKRTQHVFIYCALVSSIVIFSFWRSVLVFKTCMKASEKIFKKLLDCTIQVRLHYFEKTCAGHAINRLAKDMVIIDDLIPITVLEVLGISFEICGALFILGYANPWFIIPAIAFFFANLMVYKIYHLSAADLKRIEGNARTPVYAHLNKTLKGVTTIRAFQQEQAFSMIFDRLQDNHTSSWYLFLATQTWLAVIIDCISVILIGSICISLFYVEDAQPAMVGLTISKMIELSILIQFAASEMSNAETQMISVERVLEFCRPKYVDQFEDFDGPKPPKDWPTEGNIEIKHVSINPHGCRGKRKDFENKFFDLSIEGGEWVAIVGKTGSGKTTLLNTLFHLADVRSGTVTIDGVDVCSIGLHELRSRVSMIPQVPCMYQGTLRQNLDPLNLFKDEEIWNALKEATLYDTVQKLEGGLDAFVTEFGMNFSTGQRQFICLARAILEKNKIICCDEPTACLDGLSQMLLHIKLKEHFGNATVLFVAHRIHSIVDCDRVIVLETGQIVEEGAPLDMLMKTSGPFHHLVSHLGRKHIDDLIDRIRSSKLQQRRKSVSGGKNNARRKSIVGMNQ